MAYSLFGQVVGVRKFVNGDLEIDFYHDDEITTYVSSDSGRLDNFPKQLSETMASTLSTEICIEIFFDDNGNPSHIELEECDDEDDLEDELDEDFVAEES